MYNEIKYWNKRVQPNSSLKTNMSPISYIKKHLKGCKYVLDFGPGVGRTFTAYNLLDQLECFDITNRHLSLLNTASLNYGFKLNFTLGNEVGVTPYKNKEFDAAVVCQVLLHQRPCNINKVMGEILRVSNKVIVISWFEDSKPFCNKNVNNHCFNYDYLKICSDFGWKTFDVRYKPKHIFFVYRN